MYSLVAIHWSDIYNFPTARDLYLIQHFMKADKVPRFLTEWKVILLNIQIGVFY